MLNDLFDPTNLFDPTTGKVVPAALDNLIAIMLSSSEPPTDLQVCNIMRSFSAVKFEDTLASLQRLRSSK